MEVTKCYPMYPVRICVLPGLAVGKPLGFCFTIVSSYHCKPYLERIYSESAKLEHVKGPWLDTFPTFPTVRQVDLPVCL